ncbi:MAG: DUF420 domain-containing protein [Cyanobacteria bacterium P01_H01_bin.74]
MIYSILSSVAILLLFVGWLNRKKIRTHMAFMSTAFVLDIAILLMVELNKSAILTTSKNLFNPQAGTALLLFHVLVSVLMLVFYVMQLRTGYLAFQGVHQTVTFHRNVGMAFFTCRLLNYITSFWVITS